MQITGDGAAGLTSRNLESSRGDTHAAKRGTEKEENHAGGLSKMLEP